jgi:hypothetical protein
MGAKRAEHGRSGHFIRYVPWRISARLTLPSDGFGVCCAALVAAAFELPVTVQGAVFPWSFNWCEGWCAPFEAPFSFGHSGEYSVEFCDGVEPLCVCAALFENWACVADGFGLVGDLLCDPFWDEQFRWVLAAVGVGHPIGGVHLSNPRLCARHWLALWLLLIAVWCWWLSHSRMMVMQMSSLSSCWSSSALVGSPSCVMHSGAVHQPFR